MTAIVIYESHWGSTAAIARAMAEGLGVMARAMSTSEASREAIADIDLIVAGAPLLGFRLPTDAMLRGIAANQSKEPVAPDLSHPALPSWLGALPAGRGRCAGFETRIWWSPGSATKANERALVRAGYEPARKGQNFIVKGKYGPLRTGELEPARLWGIELAQALG